jgi:hypothetical protein
MERWRPIEGCPKYLISNEGRVMSVNYHKRIILKTATTKTGYNVITICINYIKKHYLISRLVAQTFIPNPFDLPEVNHKDTNKDNNKSTNLEWCDHSYNLKHAYNNNLISIPNNRGSRHGMSKFIEEDIPIIRDWTKEMSITKLANMLGVTTGAIKSIKYNKTWRHIC